MQDPLEEMRRRNADLDVARRLHEALPEAERKLEILRKDGEPGLGPLTEVLAAAKEAAGRLLLRHKGTA